MSSGRVEKGRSVRCRTAFLDVPTGGVISKTPIEFAAQVGFGNGNGFLNVQNIGGVQGEWKISFEK